MTIKHCARKLNTANEVELVEYRHAHANCKGSPTVHVFSVEVLRAFQIQTRKEFGPSSHLCSGPNLKSVCFKNRHFWWYVRYIHIPLEISRSNLFDGKLLWKKMDWWPAKSWSLLSRYHIVAGKMTGLLMTLCGYFEHPRLDFLFSTKNAASWYCNISRFDGHNTGWPCA